MNTAGKNLQDYQESIKSIESHLSTVGLGFYAKSHRLTRFIPCLFQSAWLAVYCMYCLFFEPVAEMVIKTQLFWAFISLSLVVIKGTNWKFQGERIEKLMIWYNSIYTTKLGSEYQALLEKRLTKQNFQIKMGVLFFKVFTYCAGVLYLFEPLAMGDGRLPTQLYWNGLRDDHLPTHMFYFFYISFGLNSISVVCYIVSIEGFFLLSMFVIGNRFAFIGDILRLLNYQGVRNRKRDRNIIQAACYIHLEVFE